MSSRGIYAMALAHMKTDGRWVDVIRQLDPQCISDLASSYLIAQDVPVSALPLRAQRYVLGKAIQDVELIIDALDGDHARAIRRPGRPANSIEHQLILVAALGLNRLHATSATDVLRRTVAFLGEPITASMLEKAERSFVASVNRLVAATSEQRLARVGPFLQSTMLLLRECHRRQRDTKASRRNYPKFSSLSAELRN